MTVSNFRGIIMFVDRTNVRIMKGNIGGIKMNYIGLINNFWHMYKTKPVSPGAVALFFVLLNQANIRMWELPICVTNEFLTADMHTSKSSFLRYREELKQNGYIGFKPKSRFMGSEYGIYVKDAKTSFHGAMCGAKDDAGTACGLKTENETGRGLSTYNIKTKTKNSNKNFKNKYNNYEIYNSGRYDFEKIEAAARKKLLAAIEKAKSEENGEENGEEENRENEKSL